MKSIANIVLRKELAAHVRDRRSVLAALVMPVSGPIFFVIMLVALSSWMRDKPLDLPVQGAANAPTLVSFLESEGIRVQPMDSSPERLVKDGKAKMGLVIPDDFGQTMATGRPADMTMVVDRSLTSAAKDTQRVQMLLLSWSQRIGTLRLFARGVDPSLAHPVRISELDVATPAQRAAQLLAMIPLFLMMAAFIGGQNLVIDVTAGERERGSLEPLLLTAAGRGSLVLGKWAAATVASLAMTILCLFGFSLAMELAPLDDLGIPFAFTPGRFLRMLAILTPLAALGAALQMLVATYARSFKEAQTWLGFFSLVPTVPAVAVIFSPFDSALWMSAVPVLAQQSLLLDVLKLNPVSPAALALLWATSLACTFLALRFTTGLFHRESVIYGRG